MKSFEARTSLKCVTAALIAGSATTVSAQQATQTAQLEEIIVTAQKREQSIQDVPVSVTAFGEEKLQALNITNFSDYARATPGLDFQDSGATGNRGDRQVAIRGVYSPLTGSPTVAYYVDDTPVRVLDPSVFDIDHIEVLRGPQGTLYGNSSMGGLIKVVTKRPDADATDVSGTTKVSTGYTDSSNRPNVSLNGAVNVPLVPGTLAARVSGSAQYNGGFIDNYPYSTPASSPFVGLDAINRQSGVNDNTLLDFRGALRWTPTDTVSVSPNILFHRGTEGGRSAFDDTRSGFRSDFETPTNSMEQYTLYGLPVEWQLTPGMRLTSSSTYFDYQNESADDTSQVNREPGVFAVPTPPSSQHNPRDERDITQELRLASTGDGKFNWLVGGFYQYRKLVRQAIEFTPGFGAFLDEAYGTDPGTFPDLLAATQQTESTHEAAGFANVSYKLTDAFTVQGGVRYTRISSATEILRGGFFGRRPPHELSLREEANKTTPSVTLTYAFDADHMIYATAGQGFRGGAGNLPSNPDTCPQGTPDSYNPDSLWNYEIGTKTQWLDHRLTANFDVYRINWKDIQQNVVLPQPCGAEYIDNLGKAHTNGAELELSYAPVQHFTVNATAAYTDAQIDDASPSLGITAGTPIPLVSKWMFGANAEYSWPLFQSQGFLRANYTHRSEATFEFFPNNPFYNPSGDPLPIDNTKDAYGIAGASIGLKNDRWEGMFFIDNAFNADPPMGIFYFGTDTRRVTTLRPRTIGISVTTHF